MTKIIVLVGISASGKSTRARELAHKTGGVIVSRDGIRSMLFGLNDEDHRGYYQREDLWACEKIVTEVENSSIKSLIKSDKIVIADNTHLKKEYLEKYKGYGVDVEYEVVEEDLFTCLTWDTQRKRSVGEEIIKQQYSKFTNLKKDYAFDPYHPVKKDPKKRDPEKKDCIIFDLDGTLARMVNRGPFDWNKVDQDAVNGPIYDIYQIISFAQEIFAVDLMIVSGRNDESMGGTQKWLDKYAIGYDRIYLRKPGDFRKDSIVKEEIWQEIEKEYNIVCMFDDRNQVVDHARSLGHTVLQVAEGNF